LIWLVLFFAIANGWEFEAIADVWFSDRVALPGTFQINSKK
jgi:hypothetical protein